MSIAEKLVTIAENQQRVYDKGYEDGRAWIMGLLNGTETVFVLPEGTTKIKAGLFGDMGNLISVTMPDSVVKIERQAFQYCSNVESVNLPDGITSVGQYAFVGCKKLAIDKLPSALTAIESYAFSDCDKLTITEIPKGVVSIGNYGFNDCAILKTITFKGTPTSISETAFRNCNSLKTINVPWAEGAVANAPWGATNATIVYNYNDAKTVFYLDDGTEWEFEEGMTWAEFIESSYNVGRAFVTSTFDTDGNGTMIDVVAYPPNDVYGQGANHPVELSSKIAVGGYYYRA